VVLGDALDEEEVVAVYGSLETGGRVDHCMVMDIQAVANRGEKARLWWRFTYASPRNVS